MSRAACHPICCGNNSKISGFRVNTVRGARRMRTPMWLIGPKAQMAQMALNRRLSRHARVALVAMAAVVAGAVADKMTRVLSNPLPVL